MLYYNKCIILHALISMSMKIMLSLITPLYFIKRNCFNKTVLETLATSRFAFRDVLPLFYIVEWHACFIYITKWVYKQNYIKNNVVLNNLLYFLQSLLVHFKRNQTLKNSGIKLMFVFRQQTTVGVNARDVPQ